MNRSGPNNSFFGRKHTLRTKLIISVKNRQRVGKARGGAPKGRKPWNAGLKIARRLLKICPYCGESFETREKDLQQFCSNSCACRAALAAIKGKVPWNKGKPWSQEVKIKISDATKGREWSDISRQKVGRTIRRLYAEGNMIHADVTGAKNPNWKGGTKYAPYHYNFSYTTRRLIRERDNYTCALCNKFGNLVHHIDGDKDNPNPRLITLCFKCHGKAERNHSQYHEKLSQIYEKRGLMTICVC